VAESFEQGCVRAHGFTLVGDDRLRLLWDTVQHCAQFDGAMVEVGVYRGGSAALIHAAAPNHTLVLYDTFAGHPSVAQPDEADSHGAGRFHETSVEGVRELVGPYPIIVPGVFPETLGQHALPALAFIHCDVDLYESTRAVLEHLWPLLVVGGALVCDDYGFEDCVGALRAVEEFVRDRADVRIERLETRQARLWKVA
jgi:O-methyltransferase